MEEIKKTNEGLENKKTNTKPKRKNSYKIIIRMNILVKLNI